MSRITLKERIKQDVFLLDGAMGTELIAYSIEPVKCNDYLNIKAPEVISYVHRSYLQAGSDAILTNTFGANKYSLARHGLAAEVTKINISGAKLARQAAGEDKYVLGDIGPSGDFLKPLGNLEPEELKEAFVVQAKALLAGGVDGFIIETMTALDELSVAIKAAKMVSSDLPVFASMAFDRAGDDFKTMMGVDVEYAVSKMISLGVDAIGFNCGTLSLDDYIEIAKKYVSIVRNLSTEVAIFAEPNAGKPELVDGKVVYKVSPEDFAIAIEKIYSTGVNIIGGCCGTRPAHIEAIAKAFKKH